MSDDTLVYGEAANSSLFDFYCPYCEEVITKPLIDIGQECSCENCQQRYKIPKKRLSLSGELPKGIKIEAAPPETQHNGTKGKLSISGLQSVKSRNVTIPKPLDVSSEANTSLNKRPIDVSKFIKPFVVFIAVAAVGLGGYMAYQQGFLDIFNKPASVDTAKPKADVVFSKIDLIFDRLQKAALSRDIKDSDVLALEMLKQMSKTDESMADQAEIFEAGILKREEEIRKDLGFATESIVELEKYHVRWEGYIDDLLQQKIDDATSNNKEMRTAWLKALDEILQNAPLEGSDLETYVMSELLKRGNWDE